VSDRARVRRALQEERHSALVAQVERLLAPFRGDERALDVGCGTGALAYALAPFVGEVVGVDSSEEYLALARQDAPDGCTFVLGDAEALRSPTATSISSAASASSTTSLGPSSSWPRSRA
jgi:ubiquinone/menaquinone biosynthesis C-methylase UbiE